MRILILLAILLAFPVLEVVLLVRLAGHYGWWVLGYVLLVALSGWSLIVGERIGAFARMALALRDGQHPALALLASARNLVAGLLLIFPGVISDILAVVLLLLPISLLQRRFKRVQTVQDHVIEGEWRRDD